MSNDKTTSLAAMAFDDDIGLSPTGRAYVEHAKRAALGFLDVEVHVVRDGPALVVAALATVLDERMMRLSDPFMVQPDDRGLARALDQVLGEVRNEYMVIADRLESVGDVRAAVIRSELGLFRSPSPMANQKWGPCDGDR